MVLWSPISLAGLHVDPIFLESKAVVDATGHDADVLRVLEKKHRKLGIKVPGGRSGYARIAEKEVVEKTGKVIPGLYVTGMAVASLYGLPRMGPIFSSMLLSGRKVADEIIRELK